MLVCTRKVNQRLFIGNDICITVVEIGNGRTRIGVDAPKSVPIVRDEIAPAALVEAWEEKRAAYVPGSPK